MLSQQIYWWALRLTTPCSESTLDLKQGLYLSFSSVFFLPTWTIQRMKLSLQIILAALKLHFHLIFFFYICTDHLHQTSPIRPSSASHCLHGRRGTVKFLICLFHSPASFCSLWNGTHFHRPSAYRHAATCTLPLHSSLTPWLYFVAHASSQDFQ